MIDLKNRIELNDNTLDALLPSDKYAGLPSAFFHRKLMTVNDDIGESDWHELIK